METTQVYKSDLTADVLEAALPTLTAKLLELKQQLSGDDQQVFSNIITSAASHLATLQSVDNVEDNFTYSKPISAQATSGVRDQILNLPATLGLN